MYFDFMDDYAKVIIWLVLSVSTATLSYFVYRVVSKIKKERDKKNFADHRYVIGSAIVNMERAIVYEDDASFRFFARYAIRACLDMGKSYPPNEPSVENIRERLIQKQFEESLIEKVLRIYSLETLPEDSQEWQNIFKDTHKIVKALLK